MADNTVVALFDSYSDAERGVTSLVNAGISRDRIDIASDAHATSAASAGTTTGATARHEDESIGDRISHFFSRLFGGDDRRDDVTYYSEAVRRGGAVVTVDAATEADADRAAEILHSSGAIDIDERADQWRQSGWAGSPAGAGTRESKDFGRTNEQVIPVVNEELQVGKRRRERGGVRIYTHIEEQPVEEKVRLREEHARVERRPADRPATEADLAAFKEGTIEVRETVEEPVVAKDVRVVEEVVIGKETTERVESVNDTVRRREVDVEKLDARSGRDPSLASRDAFVSRDPLTSRDSVARGYDDYDNDFRTHWQTNYSRGGGVYEDYQPAYRYGSTLASDERYRNRDWNDIEMDARRDWDTRNPGGTWERFKAAVRHGWERVTNRR
jgi:uncharacterized protein (TIGR02271 family)